MWLKIYNRQKRFQRKGNCAGAGDKKNRVEKRGLNLISGRGRIRTDEHQRLTDLQSVNIGLTTRGKIFCKGFVKVFSCKIEKYRQKNGYYEKLF